MTKLQPKILILKKKSPALQIYEPDHIEHLL